MTTLTQKERLASLEAQQSGHDREHELADRVWAAKLDAIDARVRSIERILREVRVNGHQEDPPSGGRLRLSKREVGVMSGSAAAASAAWWLLQLAQGVLGG
jgi:hypothetical protein